MNQVSTTARPLALVTGSARGLGRELARGLARRGYALLLTDLPSLELDAVATELDTAAIPADLTKEDDLLRLVEQVRSLGRLDLLVNNAGYVKGGPFLDVPWDDHLRTFEVNLLAPCRLLRELLPLLLNSPKPGLITIASASSLIGFPFASTYGSSKWGIAGLTESLRQELEEQGHKARILCAFPSYIDTGMFAGARAPFLMPFLKPLPLAEKVLKHWEGGSTHLLEPALLKWVPLLQGVLPRFAQDFVFRMLGVQHGMKEWTGRRLT